MPQLQSEIAARHVLKSLVGVHLLWNEVEQTSLRAANTVDTGACTGPERSVFERLYGLAGRLFHEKQEGNTECALTQTVEL